MSADNQTDSKKPARRPHLKIMLLPIILLGLLLTESTLAWLNAINLSTKLTQNQSRHTVEEISLRIDNLLRERSNDLALLTALWKAYPDNEQQANFLNDATAIIAREPSYHVINFIDQDNIIRNSAPAGKRPELLNLDLNKLPGRQALFQKIVKTGKPVISPPFELTTNQQGIIIRYPIYLDSPGPDSFAGMLAAALHLDTIIHQVLSDADPEDFFIRIQLNNTEIFRTNGLDREQTLLMDRQGTSTSMVTLGKEWRISLLPRPGSPLALLPKENNRDLMIDIAISILATILMTVALLINDHSAELTEFNKQLKQEIIDRQNAEAAQQKWSQIFKSADWGVATCNAQTKALEIINPAFAAMHGFTEQELIGTHMLDLFPAECHQELTEHLQATDQKGSHTFESQHLRKDKTVFPVLIDLTVVRDDLGNPLYQVGHIRDLTDRKKTEKEQHTLQTQLAQAQKMQTVGRLAGGLAHDFNNILTAILGYSEIALEKIDSDHPAREFLKIIHDSGEKAEALTRQLLAFSRKQVLAMRTVEPNSIIVNLGRMLGRMIGEDIDIRITTPETTRKILADPGQIEQILMNLAVNARDAMPDGGTLQIKTADINIRKTETLPSEINPGKYVLISVTDSGTGIPAAIQDRIFEPFFTTKELGKGTGLGLATVYGIVKQHKGYIYVDSTPETGTTFKVYLPAVQGKLTASEKQAALEMPEGSETILVAEDEAVVRQLIYHILQPLGYKILEATNGEEALQVSANYDGGIDLLLTDVIMPGINGRELADCVQVKRPEIKVVYMSGYTDDVIGHHGILDPGIVLLQKPVTPSLLANRLRTILDQTNGATDPGRSISP